jgi:hypothetical protein
MATTRAAVAISTQRRWLSATSASARVPGDLHFFGAAHPAQARRELFGGLLLFVFAQDRRDVEVDDERRRRLFRREQARGVDQRHRLDGPFPFLPIGGGDVLGQIPAGPPLDQIPYPPRSLPTPAR